MYDILALYCKGTSLLFKCNTEKPERPRDHRRNKTRTPNGHHAKPNCDAANNDNLPRITSVSMACTFGNSSKFIETHNSGSVRIGPPVYGWGPAAAATAAAAAVGDSIDKGKSDLSCDGLLILKVLLRDVGEDNQVYVADRQNMCPEASPPHLRPLSSLVREGS